MNQPTLHANAPALARLNPEPAKAPTLALLPGATVQAHAPMSAEEILAILLCLADKAESRAVVAMLAPPPGSKPEHTFSDLRLDIAGDITEALNEIRPGLGLRLMRCLYPEVDFDSADVDVPPLPQLFDEVPS